MSIIIFGDIFTFPDGGAATSRVYTYAKGFNENGVKTHVVCFSNEYVDISDGIIEGINYYHPFGQKKRSNHFIVRQWKKILKFFKTYSLIRKINKDEKIIAINSWTNFFSTYLFAWLLSKLFNVKLIIECSEHPLRFYQNGLLRKKKGVIKFYVESHLCDGIFCISKYLIDFYKKRNISDEKLFLVPSTVDPSRFAASVEKPFSEPYIGYFGSLTFKRDNVDMLVKAFAILKNTCQDTYLVLGGFSTNEQKKKIAELAEELNIISKVKVLELLPREEILKYISNADILVMVRAKDLESDASYPSKLTEFLSTGKPVVTVNVGEVSDYLSDGVNAFIVEPGDPQKLADKLSYVFNNYALARKVGYQGKKLTLGIFNYNYQSKRMISFINSLISDGY